MQEEEERVRTHGDVRHEMAGIAAYISLLHAEITGTLSIHPSITSGGLGQC